MPTAVFPCCTRSEDFHLGPFRNTESFNRIAPRHVMTISECDLYPRLRLSAILKPKLRGERLRSGSLDEFGGSLEATIPITGHKTVLRLILWRKKEIARLFGNPLMHSPCLSS